MPELRIDSDTEMSPSEAYDLAKGLLHYCEIYGENADYITVDDVLEDLITSLSGEVTQVIHKSLRERQANVSKRS